MLKDVLGTSGKGQRNPLQVVFQLFSGYKRLREAAVYQYAMTAVLAGMFYW